MDSATYDEFRQNAVTAFRSVRGDVKLIRGAVEQYLRKGYGAGLVGPELIDFFCVDTPNILEDAGYSDTEITAAVDILDDLHPRIYKELGKRV